MLIFSQSTGVLTGTPGFPSVKGYAGHGAGKDNPSDEDIADVGPIPRGVYQIGAPYDDPEKGPCVMRLTPIDETQTFGRSGFLIHGDSVEHPGEASLGCVILPRWIRLKIAALPDSQRILTVVH